MIPTIEQLEVCVAWAAGELAEGQAIVATGLDRQAARELYNNAIQSGKSQWRVLKSKRTSHQHDLIDAIDLQIPLALQATRLRKNSEAVCTDQSKEVRI